MCVRICVRAQLWTLDVLGNQLMTLRARRWNGIAACRSVVCRGGGIYLFVCLVSGEWCGCVYFSPPPSTLQFVPPLVPVRS